MNDKQMQALREYGVYKTLILKETTHGKNTIVEHKNGKVSLAPIRIKPFDFGCDIQDVERITVFIDDKEYEFVSCQ